MIQQKVNVIKKQRICDVHVMANQQTDRPFTLYTDSSGYGVGSILTQEFPVGERVIQYVSKKLNETQQRWPIVECEAFAIV